MGTPTTELQPPTWLVEEDPNALAIWQDVVSRLTKRGLLEHVDPAAIAGYAFCVSRALYWEALGPARVRTFHDDEPGNYVVAVWRRGAQFAANMLGGLFPLVPVSFAELLLDDFWDELDDDGGHVYRHGGLVTYRLVPDWQLPGADD
jgi:phage terminase small subunit